MTLLKNLGVLARDGQLILRHSRVAVTLEICTHKDKQAQRDAPGKIVQTRLKFRFARVRRGKLSWPNRTRSQISSPAHMVPLRKLL